MIYFPNLNGLRFIAAFLVITCHIELIKSFPNIDHYWGTLPFIGIIGSLGVVLFFVLSGFLITYLLLSEELKYHHISIKNFYVRRILRIWPLYLLIILLAFLILPNIDFFTLPGLEKEIVYKGIFLKIILYLFFLPNLVFPLFGTYSYATHTWSIGTEEQYYLAWPFILRLFKKNRISLMFFIVLVYLLIAGALTSDYSNFIPHKQVIKDFFTNFHIDCLAIGSFFALLLFQKSRFLKLFINKYLFYITVIFVCTIMLFGIHIPYIHTQFYATLFGIVIINFAANSEINISLENKILNYLGKISYGLYMYHPICIVLSLQLARIIDFTSNWLLYPLSFIFTIFISAISYRFYESIFLRYKIKFSAFLSGGGPARV